MLRYNSCRRSLRISLEFYVCLHDFNSFIPVHTGIILLSTTYNTLLDRYNNEFCYNQNRNHSNTKYKLNKRMQH